jgi:pyrimidine deaminase RibD-like protein
MSATHPALSTTSLSAHLNYLQQCLSLAQKSSPKPSNFRVGAILVLRRDTSTITIDDKVLSTGFTLELPGNTHAEQCCLSKFATAHHITEDCIGDVLAIESQRDDTSAEEQKVLLYVTMEPCGRRLSGNVPCAQRIIQTKGSATSGMTRGIEKVYFGVKEPGTFVGESQGCKMLSQAGVLWEHIPGLEKEILDVATAGHGKEDENNEKNQGTNTSSLRQGPIESGVTSIDNISAEERRRQEQMPRNPKKRMMDTTMEQFQ